MAQTSSRGSLQAPMRTRLDIPILVLDGEDPEGSCCICGENVAYVWQIIHMHSRLHLECLVKSCDRCWAEWTWTQIDRVDDLHAMNCICNSGSVSLDTIRTILTREEFLRISDKAALNTSKRLPHWMACPSAECTYGHIHDIATEGTRWVCQRHKCGTVACVSCRSPWHEGETCLQFNDRTKLDISNIRIWEPKDSNIPIKECPKCGEGLYKNEGCDHMTCICGHEFCWECSGTYLHEENIEGLLLAIHGRTCPYHDSSIRDGLQFYPLSRREMGRMRISLCFADRENARKIKVDFGSWLETDEVEVAFVSA